MPNVRLRAVRESLRLSQEEFADRIGCSLRTVQRWETAPAATYPMRSLVRSLEQVTGQPIEKLGFDVLPGADFWADHDAGIVRTPPTTAEAPGALNGIWESRCTYASGSRSGEEFLDLAHLVLIQSGTTLSAQSVPGSTTDGSTMLQLELRGHVVTGTWEVATTANSYYHGLVFHGGLQLRLDQAGGSMTGKWVGFGSEDDINTGPWTLILRERDTGRAGDYAHVPDSGENSS